VKQHLSYASVTATLALLLALGGTTAVGAQALLTGRDVKDGSLTGADIQNDSLTGADLRDGSLGSNALSAAARENLRGATGPMGAKGEAGATGAQGPAGLGVTTAQVSGNDAPDYQDGALLATTTLSQAGDYVLFVDVTAHNTGGGDGNVNCGLYLDGSGFGGGGANVAMGATITFATVGATHLGTNDAKTVTLSCNVDTTTTYDLSSIKFRIHNLG
jgi:hypothetical protein